MFTSVRYHLHFKYDASTQVPSQHSDVLHALELPNSQVINSLAIDKNAKLVVAGGKCFAKICGYVSYKV